MTHRVDAGKLLVMTSPFFTTYQSLVYSLERYRSIPAFITLAAFMNPKSNLLSAAECQITLKPTTTRCGGSKVAFLFSSWLLQWISRLSG